MLLVASLAGQGCAVKIGQGFTDGVMKSATGGSRRSKALNPAGKLIEGQLVARLGEQLGEGLRRGALEFEESQQEQLEATIAALMAVLSSKTGEGLRKDVSPEFREMITKDIVGAFVDGLRGELGESLEETAERVIDKAITTLQEGFDSDRTRIAIADTLRDAFYLAFRDGRPGAPAVGETLENTLTQNLLEPMEDSVGLIAQNVNDTVAQSAQRTENTLKTIISALVILIGVGIVMYALTRRQLNRARESQAKAQKGLQTFGAALDHLDATTREEILAKLAEYQTVAGGVQLPPKRTGNPAGEQRSNAYERGEE